MTIDVAEADLLCCPALVAIEGVIYVLAIRGHYLGKLRVELAQSPHPLRVVPLCVNRVKHAYLTTIKGLFFNILLQPWQLQLALSGDCKLKQLLQCVSLYPCHVYQVSSLGPIMGTE